MRIGTLKLSLASFAFAASLALGCGHDGPAAPHDLTAELLEGAVRLTWEDAADDEDAFIVERRVKAVVALEYDTQLHLPERFASPKPGQRFGIHFIELAELPANTEEFLDTDVEAGLLYVYRVKAVNDAGSSTSDEVEITVL